MLSILFVGLVYGVFATIFHDTEMVGDFTMEIGRANIAIFGYMAYINLFLVAYLIHIYLKYKKDIQDIIVGWTLLFLSLIMLQPLIFDIQDSGIIASILYMMIDSILGKVGYTIFTISSFIISVALLESSNQFRELYQELCEIDTNRQKKMKELKETIKETISPAMDSSKIDFDTYTPPKPKSKLERERERLRKMAMNSSKSQVA